MRGRVGRIVLPAAVAFLVLTGMSPALAGEDVATTAEPTTSLEEPGPRTENPVPPVDGAAPAPPPEETTGSTSTAVTPGAEPADEGVTGSLGPDPAWTAATPSVFGLGDSLFAQCGETLGLGSRSSGIIGWHNGTSTDVRTRLTSTRKDWPYLTESSHAEEVANWQDASTWVIGLGTNDVRGGVTVVQFQANVDWFMQMAAGRPVLWFNLYDPSREPAVDAFNQVLADAAGRWSNLRILDWHGYAAAHPEALHPDRVHLASYQACRDGRFALIQAAVPPVSGQADSPEWVDPAPVAPPSPNPITVKYQAAGGGTGPLGTARGPITCGRKKDGCAQFFANGAITWSAGTGAQILPAPVASAWAPFAETGRVGYAVGGAACGLKNGGCRQQFEYGWMYWSAGAVPREVIGGPILTKYLAAGAERGNLGYPRGAMTCGLAAAGCVQHFDGGAIYWSARTNAQSVSGVIRLRWSGLGGQSGILGYPTMDTRCGLRGGGCGQHFEGGTMYWSSTTGARVLGMSVRSRYLKLGAEKSSLGYPRTDTTCALRGGGCGQHFQGGSLFAASRTAVARLVLGAIRSRWIALGGVNGRYGYPLTDPYRIAGGLAQRFQGGIIAYRNGRWL